MTCEGLRVTFKCVEAYYVYSASKCLLETCVNTGVLNIQTPSHIVRWVHASSPLKMVVLP